MPRGGQSAPAVADVMGESGPASDRRERSVMAGKSAVPKRQASRRVVVIQLAPSQTLGRDHGCSNGSDSSRPQCRGSGLARLQIARAAGIHRIPTDDLLRRQRWGITLLRPGQEYCVFPLACGCLWRLTTRVPNQDFPHRPCCTHGNPSPWS
jgi:hypothetical protein